MFKRDDEHKCSTNISKATTTTKIEYKMKISNMLKE